ncbi:MBL fold metallo-hydrolase [Fluviispira multicolorata]|uniref:MBL fold metallo-hydrolase n=1 Tax=Fluviispira multicolorata TaxID=2654512 RepID=A0A833N5H4_9BACT|nr:MBL fold metallo-hydrolase [Fluviispira multicolorata]KAB8030757.1 MBL fold metallo-hydrolase [Fluviispira multicolorata]
MKVIPIEGNTQKLDGGAMFGNAPKTMWESWVECDKENRINLSCRSLLIQNKQGKNILFEAGVGAFFEPKLKDRFGVVEKEHVLLNNLQKNNIPHEKIDAVVLSHLHFDHAGGLLSAYNEGETRLLFPNAKFYVGKEHWQRAINPHPRDKASFIPILNNLLEKSGRLVLIEEDGKSDLAPFVTFRFSNGHTPGLMLAEIHLENYLLVFASDLIPGFAWMHIPISMGYDRYPELVIDEKKKFLDDLYTKNAKLFFTHDTKHPFASIKRDEKGKYSAEVFEFN